MPLPVLEDLTLPQLLQSIGAARWRDGGFSWPSGDTGAGVPVEDLLAHASRRLEELAEIRTLVPSEDAVLVMAPQPPEGAVQINISPAEWRVLVMVDGRRPVREMAIAAGLDDVATMKILYGLVSAGLVTLTSPATAAVAAPLTEARAAETRVVEAPVAEVPPEQATPVSDHAYRAPDVSDASYMSDTLPEEEVTAPPAFEDPTEAPTPAPIEDAFEPPAGPGVDRSTAARELAGLFDDLPGFGGAPYGHERATPPPAPPRPRRLEDDDQVTRGLISRLIDGVKAL